MHSAELRRLAKASLKSKHDLNQANHLSSDGCRKDLFLNSQRLLHAGPRAGGLFLSMA